MKKSTLTATALVPCAAVVAIYLGGCGKHRAEPAAAPLPPVQTVVVTRGTATQSLTVTGILNALPGQEATLVPLVTGTLLSLNVQLGQSVNKDDVIAQISSLQAAGQIRQAQATLEQDQILVQQAEANALQSEAQTQTGIAQGEANVKGAQAALDGAEATLTGDDAALDNAQRNMTRMSTLSDQGLVAQKDLEAVQLNVLTAKSAVDVQQKQIESQMQTVAAAEQALVAAKTGILLDSVKRKDILAARQQVANAQAALDEAKAAGALYTLHAPLTGKVTEIGATQGESVDTSTKVATIADLSRLQVSIGVPSATVSGVHPGQRILFTADIAPEKVFTTTVEQVSTQVDTTSGTVPVYATIDNTAGALKDNMTISGTIIESRRNDVIDIPQTALLSDPNSGAKSVALVGADSTLHIVQVTAGETTGGKVEIISGLSAGQHIAVSGIYGLTDGAKVDAHDIKDQQSSPDGP